MSQQHKPTLFTRLRGLVLPALLSVAAIAPAVAQQQETPVGLSIREALDYAGQNNSNIKVSRFDQEIAQKQINEIKGSGLPQANITGNYVDNLKLGQLVLAGGFPGSGGSGEEGAKATTITLGQKYNSTLSGEVTQMVLNPSFWVGLKAAKQSVQLYQQQTQQVTEQTAYNVASAYYQSIVVQKQLDLLKTNLASINQSLAMTELQYKNGVAKQVDVNRLRVNANNVASQIRQTEMNLAQALNSLKYLMGMPLEQEVVLSDTTLTYNEDQVLLADAPENVYDNRIDYKILETSLELQKLDQKNKAAGYLPSISAFANYGYQAQGSEFGLYATDSNGWIDYTTSSIGLRLNIPVFDGLQRNARIQQSKLKAQQLQENMKLTRQAINLDVSNALTQYRNTLQRINEEQQNVELAQQVYQVTQLEFREGVGTSTDVVEAETSLRQAQNTYITTLLNLYTARLDLEKAKGNLITYLNTK